MKSKVAVGQCYEYRDQIYEVVAPWKFVNKIAHGKRKYWVTRHIVTKVRYVFNNSILCLWRRPFNTEG